MNKDTFCILPFKSIYVKPNGNVSPCCVSKELNTTKNFNTSDINSVLNSKSYKSLRKQLIEGKKPSVCSFCWEKESTGLSSFRHYWNENLGTDYKIKDDYSIDVDLEYIDVRLSNLCNFKCIMCVHEYSSNHYTDIEKSKGLPRVLKIRENFISELTPLLSNLKYVYFAGGEPLITPEHFELLEYLHKNNRNISLSYNTNLSSIKYNMTDLIEMWKDFDQTDIQISIDGLYEKGESIRVGMDSDKIINNILELKESGINYNLSYTVGSYNINNIFDFISEVKRLKLIDTEEQINFNNLVLTPIKFSIKKMTDAMKMNSIQYLYENINLIETDHLKNQIYDLIDFMKTKINII